MSYGEDLAFEAMMDDHFPVQPEERPMVEIGRTAGGYTIYRQDNGAGGHSYWSDAIGGGVCVWDTCLTSVEELEFCMNYEKRMERDKQKEMDRD